MTAQNKILNEHNIILSNKCEELLDEKMRFQAKIKTEIKNSFENIYNNLVTENTEKNYYLSQEILYLYKIITESEINSNFLESDVQNNIVDIKMTASLNNGISNSTEKKITNIGQYNNNNQNIKKHSSQLGQSQKLPINTGESKLNSSESNLNKQSAKNLNTLNNSISNSKPTVPIRKDDNMDDSIKKVEEASNTNIVKELNCENRGLTSNYATKSNLNTTSKSNGNKVDSYINKFLNK